MAHDQPKYPLRLADVEARFASRLNKDMEQTEKKKEKRKEKEKEKTLRPTRAEEPGLIGCSVDDEQENRAAACGDCIKPSCVHPL